MSRHRAVRNLDLDDELDDAAFSDEDQEEYPGITPDQQVQLASGLSSVQSVLGTGSGLTDKEIKDALWYYYFDQEKTISYLLDQQHKKNAAKEKAEADQTEDATLAEETQSHLAIRDLQSEPSKESQPPAKRSLAALAAAAKKPSSASTSSLSSLAAAKSKVNASVNGKSSLSKLAAKSQAAAESPARRPLGSLASKAPATETASTTGDVEMEGASVQGPTVPTTAVSKLSKLQQRMQRGSGHPDQQAMQAAQQAKKEDEEKSKKDTWQLPSSSLFPKKTDLSSAPSPFAGVLVPEHHSSTGPEPDAITAEAIKAGHEKLPKLYPNAVQQKGNPQAASRTR